MSLSGKVLQVIDTCDCYLVANGKTIFSGSASKANIDQKVDTIDIFSGVGQNKTASLNTKKQMSTKITIAEFNLDFFATINGVALDKTSTGTIFFGVSTPVSTLTATVTGATRVLSVRKLDGTFLNIVSTAPASLNEVRVSGTTLTFYTGFADSSVLVSYQGTVSGKDNYTIVFNANSFPQNFEMLLKTVVFDQSTETVVGSLAIDFYKVSPKGDFSLPFEMGKNVEIDMELDILVPSYLPDGTANTQKDIGKMYLTEI